MNDFVTINEHINTGQGHRKREISLARANILAVAAPQQGVDGRYHFLVIRCHNPSTVEVAGSEQEMWRLYNLITGRG